MAIEGLINPTVKSMPPAVQAETADNTQKLKADLKQLFSSCNLSESGYIKYSDIKDPAVLGSILTNINKILTNKGLDPIKSTFITDDTSLKTAIEQYQKATGKQLGNGNGIGKYADGLLGKKTFEAMFPGLVPSNSGSFCLATEESILSNTGQTEMVNTIGAYNGIKSGSAEKAGQELPVKDVPITITPVKVDQLKNRDATLSTSIRISSCAITILLNNLSHKDIAEQLVKQSHLNLSQDETESLIEWFQRLKGAGTLEVNDKLLIPTKGQLNAIQEEKIKRKNVEALLSSLPERRELMPKEAIGTVVEDSLKLFPVNPGLKPLTSDFVMRQMLQESGNSYSAESPVGASGLMQIMPPTARGIANELLANNYQLSEDEKKVLDAISSADDETIKALLKEYPKLNIMMGSYYLVQQYNNFSGHKNLALAAYNWGPDRVARFVDRKGGVENADKAMEAVAKKIIDAGSNTTEIKRLCREIGIPEETGRYIAKIRRPELVIA